jgi:hypothetical protein
MEVSGQLHATKALPPGKEPLIPIGQEAWWDPEPVWRRWWREKFPAPIIQPVAQRYTTELSQLFSLEMTVDISFTDPPKHQMNPVYEWLF